ncbi:MAG: Coenzyme F420 hydrogenase/dehydrogenase, beta subunit C-terminal domain [Thermoplasmatales archaeon]|nr:Coenzyme F420 hydrogenase/dehydrogenase, beta subunit C-terminal domain [Thermoplasmatales archaeon]
MKEISFNDLKEEVIDKGLCALCGGCTSFCRANRLVAIGLKDGLPGYINEENCLKCGICYMICPFTGELDEDLAKKYGEGVGKIIDVYSSRSTDENILKKCCDGGVATSLLNYLLDAGIVDAVLAVKKMRGGKSIPFLASSYSEVVSCAGSVISTVPSIEEIKYFSTYTSLLPELKEVGYGGIESIAMTGTPCQTKSIRKMQAVNILPSGAVNFIVGLFCIENFSFDAISIRKFEEIVGRLSDIEKINIKEKMMVEFKNGNVKEISLKSLKEVARKSCLKCKISFSNIYGDISLGGIGSEKGYTSVIIRNDKGRKIFEEAIDDGYIEIHPEWDKSRKEKLIKIIEEWTIRKEKKDFP